MLATNYPSHVALRDWWRLCRPLTKSRAGTSLAARGPGWAGWPGGWWPPPGEGLIRMRKPGAGPGWGSTGRSRRGSGGTRTRPPRHSQTWSWCSAPSPGSRDPITRHVSHVPVSRMAQLHFNTIQCVPLLYPALVSWSSIMSDYITEWLLNCWWCLKRRDVDVMHLHHSVETLETSNCFMLSAYKSCALGNKNSENKQTNNMSRMSICIYKFKR